MSPFESVEDGEDKSAVAGERVRWWTVRRLKEEVSLQGQIVVGRRVEKREDMMKRAVRTYLGRGDWIYI